MNARNFLLGCVNVAYELTFQCYQNPLPPRMGDLNPPILGGPQTLNLNDLTSRLFEMLNGLLLPTTYTDMVVPTFGVMLNDWNYGIWSQIMEVHLASKDKLGYINGDLPKPAETAPTFRQWRTENAMVKSWLIGSMDPALVANFIGFPTAKGVWDAAATTYYDGSDTSQPQVSDLNKKVSNLTKIMMSIRLRFLHVPLDDESEADNHLLDDEASEPSVDDEPEAGTNLLDAEASEPSIDDDPEADPTTLVEADEPADTDHSAGSLNDDPEADPTSLLAAEPTDLSADDEPEAGTILLRSDPAEVEGTFTPLVPTHDHLLVIGPDFTKTIATEEVFMAIPPGFEASQPGGVCKLEKASIGLEESPAAWFGRLSVANDDDRNSPWDPGGRVEGNEFDDMTSLTAKALTVSEDRMDAMQMVLWNFIKAKLEVALIQLSRSAFQNSLVKLVFVIYTHQLEGACWSELLFVIYGLPYLP